MQQAKSRGLPGPARSSTQTAYLYLQAQLTQEVKRADLLSAELTRQQDESARGMKTTKQRATSDILMGRGSAQGAGAAQADPLIAAGRPAGSASTAGSELELLRRKLKVYHPAIISVNLPIGLP